MILPGRRDHRDTVTPKDVDRTFLTRRLAWAACGLHRQASRVSLLLAMHNNGRKTEQQTTRYNDERVLQET